MIDIEQLELHVTHACNFTCEGCSHYSNHGHSGNLSLDDCEEWLYGWSRRIKPKTFTILGGEPTLNKNLPDIVYMVRAMFPDPSTGIDVITNATGLHLQPRLPQMLVATGATLAVSIHSTEHPNYIKKFKRGYKLAKKWKHDLGVWVEFWDFTNKEWVRQYKGFGDRMMPYEDNNPRKSWEVCISKYAMQLHEGKLWKCPALAYLPMQAEKYNLSDKWNPYLKYQSLDVDCTDEELEEFLNREDESFCSMCPANRDVYTKPDPTLPVTYYERLHERV
jgi:hypothetical protein|tara:strand:- start:5058 stop:5888 length:831 start_codon:yes stop_codon:yes gene_type:complete